VIFKLFIILEIFQATAQDLPEKCLDKFMSKNTYYIPVFII